MHKPHQQTDKALLALERESRKLSQAKWSKVPLDPPIRRGWKRCYFLTHAARQRPDTFVLERILETINVSRTHWRRDFSPTKRNRRRQVHHLDEQLRMPENHHFGSKRSQLPEEWRSYFVRTPVFEHKSMTWKWSFRLLQLFELRIVPNLQTEAHLLDPESERRLAEIDRKLDPKGWARLNNLHGCRRRCHEGRSAKEKFASIHASHRIRSAYQGDHEAEKSIPLPVDVLLCLVRNPETGRCRPRRADPLDRGCGPVRRCGFRVVEFWSDGLRPSTSCPIASRSGQFVRHTEGVLVAIATYGDFSRNHSLDRMPLGTRLASSTSGGSQALSRAKSAA
ncbi:MAG: hypothetical protein IAE77_08945 [Prosthecobacter sp.]|uniref:hypothetical protein n=1 Tax=Prosthecobacter sp. TaxID=1965333 RepID=UPI001A02710C|nr:hypothetical protein [Prosthecobacter sp.]MBE2283577.1 hypothetical protein [Prosthecobacter sp.]